MNVRHGPQDYKDDIGAFSTKTRSLTRLCTSFIIKYGPVITTQSDNMIIISQVTLLIQKTVFDLFTLYPDADKNVNCIIATCT